MGMQAQPQAPDSGSVAQGQALEQAASTASTVESCSSDEGGGAIQTQVDKAEAAVALVAKKKRRGGKSGRGDGRRRKHERIKQLTCLLEEVCALENEITHIRKNREADNKTIVTLRKVVMCFVAVHVILLVIILRTVLL